MFNAVKIAVSYTKTQTKWVTGTSTRINRVKCYPVMKLTAD